MSGDEQIRDVHPWNRRGWLTALGVSLLVFGVSAVIASSGEVPGWEQAIFRGINGLPEFLNRPMWLFQLTGLVLLPAGLAVVALLFRRWRLAAALLLLWPYLPGGWKWLPAVIAALAGTARVYLGAHNPLDVIGGGAVGVTIGVLLSMLVGVPGRGPVSEQPAASSGGADASAADGG